MRSDRSGSLSSARHTGPGTTTRPQSQHLQPSGTPAASPFPSTPTASLHAGTLLGPYEIIDLIGVGGMGEVYRARDTRLDRIVAIKTLPRLAALDPGQRLRVEREARIVAGLSHPHICALFDIGREGAIDYFVMEYLDGQTLASRLSHGLLPVDLVLEYGAQIAAALDAAHRHGAVHCDLKPANIMLTRDGVKLLDFGIAQMRAERCGRLASGLTDELPTLEATPLDRICAGTLHYMAPEQLRAGTVDGRTDVFALGAVLYQMLAGRPPFEGSTEAIVVAAILEADPPPLLPGPSRPVPASLERLIRTCLAKAPDDRWQSARDLGRELAFLAGARETATGPKARVNERRWPWWQMLAVAMAAWLATVWVMWSPSPPMNVPPSAPRVLLDVKPAPPAALPTDQIEARVSPNGRHLAFVAMGRGTTSLWVRSFDEAAAREVPGTEGASQPFWAPDSRSIGFYAQGALKRVSLESSVVQVLCLLPVMAGATWSPRGVIVFSRFKALARVPDHGGTPALLPSMPFLQDDAVAVWPQFLPDGRRYLVRVVRGPRVAQGVYAGDLDTPTLTRVLDTTANVVPAGRHLLVALAGNLVAQRFDAARVSVSGAPVVVIDSIMENLGQLAGPSISVSDTGVLAYRPRRTSPTTLTWFDRRGLPGETLSAPAGCRNPEISPDRRRVAVECRDIAAGTRDLWVLDATSGRPARLTTDAADDSDPIWSPDGRWIVFSSARDGGRDLYRRPSTGAGQDDLLLHTARTKYPNSWSPDGRLILFTSRERETGWDIWLLPLDGGAPAPVVSTPATEIEPQLSPDGRWLAYASDESGAMEVYVRPFRAAGGAWLISIEGGSDPRWRDDGTELYYLSPDRTLLAVSVHAGAQFEAAFPRTLFQSRAAGPLGLGVRFNYAVGGRGRRFLFAAEAPGAVSSPITVVLNWSPEQARAESNPP